MAKKKTPKKKKKTYREGVPVPPEMRKILKQRVTLSRYIEVFESFSDLAEKEVKVGKTKTTEQVKATAKKLKGKADEKTCLLVMERLRQWYGVERYTEMFPGGVRIGFPHDMKTVLAALNEDDGMRSIPSVATGLGVNASTLAAKIAAWKIRVVSRQWNFDPEYDD